MVDTNSIIKIAKTGLKDGIYYIHKEIIGEYSELDGCETNVMLEDIEHCISTAKSTGLKTVSTDHVMVQLKECISDETCSIVIESKDGLYLINSFGMNEIHGFGDAIYDMIK